MWAIVIVMLQALVGPEVHVVTDAGVFPTEERCREALAAAVPAELSAEARQQFEDGHRRFVCVRVGNDELLPRPK